MVSEKLLDIFLKAPVELQLIHECVEGMIFALKGENFDGNKYAQDAIDSGCVASVVDNPELKDMKDVLSKMY